MRKGLLALAGVLVSQVLFAHVATAARGASAGTAASGIVERFLTGPQELTSYRALRTLEAEARGGKMHARMTAWTSLDDSGAFQYSIVEESGSGMIRDKVLRAALEAERQMRVNRDVARGELTVDNYDFDAGAEAEDGLIRVGIRPKRRDTMLLDGSILLSEPRADLVRIEGFLTKRPSFWTREVHVVRQYTRIGGIRVPVSMRSTARVLIAGRSSFSMTYEYASINGTPVSAGTH